MTTIYPPHFKLPNYNENFFLVHVKNWVFVIEHLKSLNAGPRIVIEIGSLHGACSVWLLEHFLRRDEDFLHCIDINETEYLKNNLSPYKNVQLHLGMSSDVLTEMWNKYQKPIADLIYVDGSHIAKHVLEDGVLSWRLLKPDGIMVFDDYTWGLSGDADDQPRTGIDAFLHGYQNHWIMFGDPLWGQVYLQKQKYKIKDGQLTGNYANDNPFFNKEKL